MLYGTPGSDGQLPHTAVQPSADLIGFPMMLPYASKWSCARVRVMLWQQIARFIKEEEKQKDTPLGALLRAACPAEGQGQGQGRGYGNHIVLNCLGSHCIVSLLISSLLSALLSLHFSSPLSFLYSQRHHCTVAHRSFSSYPVSDPSRPSRVRTRKNSKTLKFHIQKGSLW